MIAGYAWMALVAVPRATQAEGYPGAAAALVAVSVPAMAAALATRLWAQGRVAGSRGLGELLNRHYGTAVTAVSATLAVAGTTALLAGALKDIATLMETMSRNAVASIVALYLVALFVALTAAPAGIRAAGAMARVHAALAVLGFAAIAFLVVEQAGGIAATIEMLARVGETRPWESTGGRGGGDYSAALAVGGLAGSIELASTHLALAGAILALVWLPWAAATPDPRRFAGTQIWGGALVGGALALTFAWLVGLGSVEPDSVPHVLARLAGDRTWAAAAIGVSAFVAMHAFALSLVAAALAMIRPLWSARARAGHGDLASSQAAALILIGAALLAALASDEDLKAGTAVAASLPVLLLLPLVSACWLPRVTGPALVAGLVGGIALAVFASTFVALAGAALVTALITIARPKDSRRGLREDMRRRVAEAFTGTAEERGRIPLAWAAAMTWAFFAVGPGVVIGNDIFGAPDLPRERWDFPLPSIAVWQILLWAAGVVLVWFLAKGVGLSAITHAQMERLSDPPQTDRQTADRRETTRR